MASILDMTPGPPDYWAEIGNFFSPLKCLIVNEHYDELVKNINLNYLINALFWIFLIFCAGYACFLKCCELFLKASTIKYYARKQFARALWNLAFFAASTLFLHFYNKFVLLPQLMKNQGRFSLFYAPENLIFHLSSQCEKFQFYSLFIISFYIHAAILDFKETDTLEAVSKILYLLALIALGACKYEDYFVGLNLSLGIYNIITEFIFILAIANSKCKVIFYQLFLAIRIACWSHIFISLLPFKYLVPTLFAKNFKIALNITLWLWYGLSIWNSPILQYFYHQIYHNLPQDCSGEGSAAKCILLKESSEYRHFKAVRKAYLIMKVAQEKLKASEMSLPSSDSSSQSVKAFQAIKCIMTLKRKLKRIREGRGEIDLEDEIDDNIVDQQ